jgi:hypothetical protein
MDLGIAKHFITTRAFGPGISAAGRMGRQKPRLSAHTSVRECLKKATGWRLIREACMSLPGVRGRAAACAPPPQPPDCRKDVRKWMYEFSLFNADFLNFGVFILGGGRLFLAFA